MRLSILLLPPLCALALLTACAREPGAAMPAATSPAPAKGPAAMATTRDEHSYAQPDKVRISDLALDLAVDFDRKQLSGTATYTLEWLDPQATQLVLDTRDLTITKVEGANREGQWTPLRYALAARDPILGSKLTIQVPERDTSVRVAYTTSPEASGLQWLEPAMTQGKQQPFMFSQSEAIHARSWVPLQDTPGVRFTYKAHVTAPANAMVLMSADNDPAAARDGDYSFTMPQPIPSYLLAIAAGDLVFEPISRRSGVWAEPAMVHKAASEFADTEKMIDVAEKLYGPYRWGRYDLLVLPPSFPFGGMENPRLTFATPTVIVGDKSLVSLVAHELAHSWSGNLVTNASWKNIWLNEGFTTYVQARITEALYGNELAEMERQIDQEELAREIKSGEIAPADQVLALPALAGRDPDEVLSDIAYTKGAWFLQFLEQRFGRDTFDPFLRGWFDSHAFKSATSDEFVDYLQANLLAKHPDMVTPAELDAWLHQPGIPAFAHRAQSRNFGIVDAARIAWSAEGKLPPASITTPWSTQEWTHFLDGLPETLPVERMGALDAAYHFSGTPNGELAQRWYPLAVRSGYHAGDDAMAAFLQVVGRRKLIMPTYEALVKTPEGLQFARDVFEKARPGYHPITTASVAALLAKAAPVASAASAADAPPAVSSTVPAPAAPATGGAPAP
ncbi:M1 family metallopeptidase [Cognatiluteimonas telluris]|uniref:M1 family metallopeptidase n=1 Tax=Cognatiluteimonas telluris TaxID=1104775 RepID=UPI00140D4BEA|nr:M1 family metallopeptidase [Lysobacter telluris]